MTHAPTGVSQAKMMGLKVHTYHHQCQGHALIATSRICAAIPVALQ